MRRRPLEAPFVCRPHRWLAAIIILVPSLVSAAQASSSSSSSYHTVSATATTTTTTTTTSYHHERGVDSVVIPPSNSSTKNQQAAPPTRSQRFRQQRQQRIEVYEEQYEQYRIEREKLAAEEERHRRLYRKQQQQRELQPPAATSGCPLCYDGSAIPNPGTDSATVPGWTCGSLQKFVAGNLGPQETECLEFATVGSTDCGCPSSPLDQDYCALCALGDGSVQLIPDKFTRQEIPVSDRQPTPGLTCADLLFVQRNGGVIPCEDLAMYTVFCGCPSAALGPPTNAAAPVAPGSPTPPPILTAAPTQAPVMMPTAPPRNGEDGTYECHMCPDQNLPQYQNRIVPYLTPSPTPQSNTLPYNEQPTNWINHCGVLAEQALQVATEPDACYPYIFPEVPLDLQSFCGCASGAPWDLCGLCMDRQPLANPDLLVPGTGGLSCLELQEYVRYITDAESCNLIAESARDVCCTPLPECPVCGNPQFRYNEEKLYPPLGLTCGQLGLAGSLTNDTLSCPQVQERFGWYCDCPNAASPACSMCGDALPDPARPIRALGPGITCGEIDEYASLRLAGSCEDELALWGIDTQSFCGCPGSPAPNTCSIRCPPGLFLDRDSLAPGDSSTDQPANTYLTCGELVDTAPFVTDPELCLAMQDSGRGCCKTEAEMTAGDAEGRVSSGGGSSSDGFVTYPFLTPHHYGGQDGNLTAASVYYNVYSREFITSPYGSSTRYYHASAAAPLWASVTASSTLAALYIIIDVAGLL